MIAIVDVYSRQNFESIKLASEILNISARKIKKSIDEKNTIEKGYKKYLFKYSNCEITRTFKIKRFPFGKYKGEYIERCKDKSYMKWLLTKTNIDSHLRIPIKRRLNEMK